MCRRVASQALSQESQGSSRGLQISPIPAAAQIRRKDRRTLAESSGRRADEVEYDHLHVLRQLSNIDKHRRRHVLTCWPDLIFWESDKPSKRQWQWGQPPFVNGAILGYLIDDPEHTEPPPKLRHEIDLRLTRPEGATRTDVAQLLEGIHQRVTGWVLRRVLNP